MPPTTLGSRNAKSSTAALDWLLPTSLQILLNPKIINKYYIEEHKRYQVLKVLKVIREDIREKIYISLCDSMYTILGIIPRAVISKLENKYRERITQIIKNSELIIKDGYFEFWTRLKVIDAIHFGNVLGDKNMFGISKFSESVLILNIIDCDIIERGSNDIELNKIPLLYDQFEYKKFFIELEEKRNNEIYEQDEEDLYNDPMDPFPF